MSEQTTQNPPAMSADDIANALKKAGIGPQQPQQPAMSQADIDKMFNRFNPGSELLERLFGHGATNESRLAALSDFARGVVKEAVTVSGHTTQHHLSQVRQEYQPALSEVSEIKKERMFEQFYKANPNLKNHDKIVKTVLRGLVDSDAEFKTPEELYKVLAETTASTIKEIDPKFTLEAQTSPASNPGGSERMFEPVRQQSTNVNPTPATLASGGQSGGVGGGGQSTGDSIFDP